MAALKFPLSKLRNEFGKHVIDTQSGIEVFHTESPHSLIQAAGYLKHTRAQSGKGVFFRGQIRLYPTLQSTLLRGTTDGPQNVKRRNLLTSFLEKVDAEKKALKAVDKRCREALLQHYGIRTTWLDVVDNVWVALWFACYEAKTVSRGPEQYMHFEKRIPRPGDKDQYAYVLLLESAFFNPIDGLPGHYKDTSGL